MKRFLLLLLFLHSINSYGLTATAISSAALCPNQGNIVVSAIGGVPFPAPSSGYTYQIIAPATNATISQSSNVFNSLAGNIIYTILVSDQVGNVTISCYVANLYSPMLISATALQPACVTSANDGKITASVNGGKSPFLYKINGPIVFPNQSSNVFNNLITGNYILTVTDACGEIRTTSIYVPASIDFTFSNLQVQSDDFIGASSGLPSTIVGNCNSVSARVVNYIQQAIPSGIVINRTIKIFENATNLLIYTNTIINNTDNNFIVYQKNKVYRIEIYDNCNTTLIKYFNFRKKGISFDHTYNNCGANASLVINTKIENTDSLYAASKNMPETFIITAGPTSVGTSITTNNNTITFNNLVPGIYTINIVDACETITKTFEIPLALPFSFDVNNGANSSCLDSTAARYFYPNNLFSDETILNYTLLTGPTSFTDVYGVLRNITYPQIFTALAGNDFFQGNYPKGTYTAKATSSCGRLFNLFFTVTNSDLTIRKFTLSVVGICSNSSSLTYTKQGQNWPDEDPELRESVTGAIFPISTQSGNQIQWQNIPPGIYRVIINTNAVTNNIVTGNCPRLVLDTLINLQYNIPTTSAIIALACANGASAQLTVNSVTGGTAPFLYEIISGPVIRPLQLSNVFTNLLEGTYVVRTIDACGNGVVTSVSTARLLPILTIVNSACNLETVTNYVRFTATNYQGASYSWTGPNGFTSTSNPLIIYNFNAATQSGIYNLTVSFPNCPPIVISRNVGGCNVVPVKLLAFNASIKNCKVELHWKTTNEINLDKYKVEYSKDAIVFREVAVKNHIQNTNTTSINDYNLVLENLPKASGFVRLKLIDLDGKFSYSEIIKLNNSCSGNLLIYPNPFKNYITIENLKGNNDFILYNSIGEIILSNSNTNKNSTTLITNNLIAGTYLLKIISHGIVTSFKLIKVEP